MLHPKQLARVFPRAATLSLLVILASIGQSARACSVCIAHALGAGLHGIGAQTLRRGEHIFSVGYLTFSKSQDGETAGIRETQHLNQINFDYNYGLTERIMLRASLPYVTKSLMATGEATERSAGLGDGTLGLFYQLPAGMKSPFLTALFLDVKIPTGSNGLRDSNGDLLEQHLQLGSGGTDVSLGVNITGEMRRPGDIWFAGLRGRVNGDNRRGFHYGDIVFYDLGMSHDLRHNNAVVLELNGRFADKDRLEDGTLDPDSGGHLSYLSLSYRHSFRGNVGLIVTYQQPVWKQLDGSQTESGLFSVSLTKEF